MITGWSVHDGNWPKFNLKNVFRSFGDALELYRKAISMAYLSAISLDRHSECPSRDDLDGRDPRW
jgi:hypothetical protein